MEVGLADRDEREGGIGLPGCDIFHALAAGDRVHRVACAKKGSCERGAHLADADECDGLRCG